jgi:hypothetical protein
MNSINGMRTRIKRHQGKVGLVARYDPLLQSHRPISLIFERCLKGLDSRLSFLC